MDRPQRLVFGTVAEAYDAHRPGYPARLLDQLAGMVGDGARCLDVGAGTGKVARALADRGLDVLRRVLRPGGVAAIFWNRPELGSLGALQADMDAAYERLAPDVTSSVGPGPGRPDVMPPTEPPPDGFAVAQVEVHRDVVRYDTASWTALLGTHSDHIRLGDERRRALHAAVGEVIDAHGGAFDLTYRCEAWIARRSSD